LSTGLGWFAWGLTEVIKDNYSTFAMTDTDSSDFSSTSDVNYSDIDFDTPNTTDMKLSDVSDYPCDEHPIKNASFERVRPFLFKLCMSLCVPNF